MVAFRFGSLPAVKRTGNVKRRLPVPGRQGLLGGGFDGEAVPVAAAGWLGRWRVFHLVRPDGPSLMRAGAMNADWRAARIVPLSDLDCSNSNHAPGTQPQPGEAGNRSPQEPDPRPVPAPRNRQRSTHFTHPCHHPQPDFPAISPVARPAFAPAQPSERLSGYACLRAKQRWRTVRARR